MDELISLLNENGTLLEEMTQVLEEERDCIIGRDLAGLKKNTRCKEELTPRLAMLQEKCAASLRHVAAEQGITGECTLSSLLAVASASGQEQLRHLQQRLLCLARLAERQHNVNRRLLQRSLGGIQACMAQFARVLGGSNTYGESGALTSGIALGSIVRQEI